MKPTGLVSDLLHDIKYGVRLLTRAPGFALAAILTIAVRHSARRAARVDPAIALRAE